MIQITITGQTKEKLAEDDYIFILDALAQCGITEVEVKEEKVGEKTKKI